MAAAKAMPSRSHGMAAVRWSPQTAMDGLRRWMTAHSKVRSASNVATKFPSSHADRPLLQQPARSFLSEVDTGSREENASRQEFQSFVRGGFRAPGQQPV